MARSRLRGYPEALAATERGVRLAPTGLDLVENLAMVYLAQGDLDGARAVLRKVPAEVEPTALAAYIATYWDLFWVLDDAQQQLLLRLRPSAFADDRGNWGIVRAQTYYHRGDRARARIYADSARIAFLEQLSATPDDGQRHSLVGLALAYMGKKDEAIRYGERALELVNPASDGYTGPYIQHQLVRIYLLLGEPEKALDKLEPLLTFPYHLSPGWLRIDPAFAPLKGNPRFEKLAAGN